MQKAKKYDWKDSNLALFGSDTEKQVKKEAAETEKAWQGSGQRVGVQIWRINKFKVESWPEDQHGQFFKGDSYIILNTYKDKESDELLYDVHFWIGQYSTQDEYGTAAYKTVELDTFLDDKPIQHREVQGHESALFKSYFQTIMYLDGGAESGFRHVLPEEYKTRLFHVRKDPGSKRIVVNEIQRQGDLKDDDVYILDTRSKVFIWKGKDSSHDEAFKAISYSSGLANERRGTPAEKVVLEQDDISENHPFYDVLQEVPEADGNDDDDDEDDDSDGFCKLLKVSDEDGSLDCEEVKDGPITKDDLNSSDVMIVDMGKDCYVWVGKGASIDERRNALSYAHSYLNGTKHPLAPVHVIGEGAREIPGVA